MSEFRKGELVAVRDSSDCEWQLRIYDHERGGQHFCKAPDNEMGQAVWWAQICPAEIVWPNVFLMVDREIAEVLREERDLHRQQICWLCERLEEASRKHRFCPPNVWPGDCDNACWECWQQAVHETVKDAKNEQG